MTALLRPTFTCDYGTGGLVFPYPNLAEAWVVLTDAGRAHPVRAARTIRRQLERMIREHQPRRVQASVVVDVHGLPMGKPHELMVWLGFQYESLMPHFGPNGETCVRYVRFPKVTNG